MRVRVRVRACVRACFAMCLCGSVKMTTRGYAGVCDSEMLGDLLKDPPCCPQRLACVTQGACVVCRVSCVFVDL